LIEETVQAPDQLVPDEPQKRVAQPQKKAKEPASNEKAHAKRDRRAPAAAKVSKPAASRKQAADAVTQKPPEAAPAVIASPTNEQALDDQSRGGSLLATAGTTWPVSPKTEDAADTWVATSINTADAASNAVQMVDANEVNELDREATVESSWINYLLWTLGAALTAGFAGFALWFCSRMGFRFTRRSANAG
jgi:hypothetical protein